MSGIYFGRRMMCGIESEWSWRFSMLQLETLYHKALSTGLCSAEVWFRRSLLRYRMRWPKIKECLSSFPPRDLPLFPCFVILVNQTTHVEPSSRNYSLQLLFCRLSSLQLSTQCFSLFRTFAHQWPDSSLEILQITHSRRPRFSVSSFLCVLTAVEAWAAGHRL